MIKPALAALLLTCTPAAALAGPDRCGPRGCYDPAYARYVTEQINPLLAEAARHGVRFQWNPAACASKSAHGWYSPLQRLVVICQDNAPRFPYVQVELTSNDFDTVRHELHHVAQDCEGAAKFDGTLDQVFTMSQLQRLVDGTIGRSGARRISNLYAGKSTHTKLLEIEAAAVAAADRPSVQIDTIRLVCG